MKRCGKQVCVLLLILSLTICIQDIHSASAYIGDRTWPQVSEYPSLHIIGFGDFNYSDTDARGYKSGFKEGQFVLHFTSALSPKVNFYGEVSLTARADAGTAGKGLQTGESVPPAPGFNPEVERGFIRFDQSDYFKVSFGRFHTPINWWNTAFHHGLWLQTSIGRPEMVQFGGMFIPVHFVGGLVEGALPTHGLNVNYNVGVGNGRGSVVSRAGDAGDNNNDRAWLINLFTKPDHFFGLQVGGSLYRDRITLAPKEFDEWIAAGHIVWQKENPELIAEYANVNHHELGSSSSSNSPAYYIQAAYRLPWFEALWKPYYRFEYIRIPRTEVVFKGSDFDRTSSIVGLRYDITQFAAIKAEYRNQHRPDQPRVNGYSLQTSFTF
ncbi:MAG: hypothetical protein HY203_11250 [Nitrospirae bacterium]|nr:hypothetical protein [Nitrospirota bacterium]